MPELIHKSRKYADLIMEKINEERIRSLVLQCWIEAYAAGFEASVQMHKEDPGK